MIRLQQNHLISASREAVEAALLDPEVLRRAIPGCQEVRRLSPTMFLALVSVGFLGLAFDVDATLEVERTAEGMAMSGQVRTGQVLVGRVESAVELVAADGRTRVASATVLHPARQRSKVVMRAGTALARRLTNMFFTRLANELAERARSHAASARRSATQQQSTAASG